MNRLRSHLPYLLSIALVFALPSFALAAEESGSETYSLEAGGRISLDNVNGRVTIEGWDQDQVQIDWVKSSRYAEDLDRMEVRIEASPSWIEVSTQYERNRRHSGGNSGEVEYTLHVPRSARLDEIETVNGRLDISGIDGDVSASTVNGDLDARELGGSVELSTVNGSLDASLTRLEAGQSIDMESVNGSLELKIPGHADADVEVETVNGRINNDFGLEVKKDRYVGRSMSGTIGRGGPRVRLESVNGSVDLKTGG